MLSCSWIKPRPLPAEIGDIILYPTRRSQSVDGANALRRAAEEVFLSFSRSFQVAGDLPGPVLFRLYRVCEFAAQLLLVGQIEL